MRAATEWARPSGSEIQEIIRRTGLPGRGVARVLGLSENGGRLVRRWVGEDAEIPYAAWALLCDLAGFERIWLNSTPRPVSDVEDD
nr:XRE family transcriptional regulator [Paraburkholderia aspalathi]